MIAKLPERGDGKAVATASTLITSDSNADRQAERHVTYLIEVDNLFSIAICWIN